MSKEVKNETALENVTIKFPAKFSFKSKKLNEYSEQIAAIGRDMAGKNVELAVILGKIKTEKAYSEDGFKSVANYAEEIFGIKKAQAYQLANVGERFYNADTPTAKRVVSMLTPANMAEIVKMDDGAIDAAIEAGAISADKTQRELRETARADKAKKDGIIVHKLHDVSAIIVVPSQGGFVKRFAERVTLPAFEADVLVKEYGFSGMVTKKFSGDSKTGTLVTVSENGSFAYITYMAASAVKAPKTAKRAFTVEELKAMLADAIAAEMDEDNEGEGD